MQTNESCRCCEKVVMTIESFKPFDMLLELPNTFDVVMKKYMWIHRGSLSFALIPQSVHGTTGIVDCFFCIDEDDLDDIDLKRTTAQFLERDILPSWENFKTVNLSQPLLAAPTAVGCWKIMHQSQEMAS